MTARKALSKETKLRLFSEAAGYCQRPECLRPLFPEEMGGDKHIAEMAHIIPHGETGPRHEDRPAADFEADTFDNLILLCPACHTMIDKSPYEFSRETLLGWKSHHLVTLTQSQGIRSYDSRAEVRSVLSAAMADNKAIWKEFAPEDGARFVYDPESEVAKTWSQRIRGVIIPNLYRIQGIIDANHHLLTDAEQQVFALFREHVRGLSERHVCGISGRAIRYPAQMDDIFL